MTVNGTRWMPLEAIADLPVAERTVAYAEGLADGRWSVDQVRAAAGILTTVGDDAAGIQRVAWQLAGELARAELAEPRSIEVTVPGRPPSVNDRMLRFRRAEHNAKWRSIGQDAGDHARREYRDREGRPWVPVRVGSMIVTFVLPTKRRHDWDNLVGSIKPILDGLVDAGLLADDSIYVLPHVYTRFEYVKGVSATTFRIVAR